jgi:hypothetical protein
MEAGGHRHHLPSSLTPEPSTPPTWLEAWVGPRADLDAFGNRNSCPCRESNKILDTMASSAQQTHEVYFLEYSFPSALYIRCQCTDSVGYRYAEFVRHNVSFHITAMFTNNISYAMYRYIQEISHTKCRMHNSNGSSVGDRHKTESFKKTQDVTLSLYAL